MFLQSVKRYTRRAKRRCESAATFRLLRHVFANSDLGGRGSSRWYHHVRKEPNFLHYWLFFLRKREVCQLFFSLLAAVRKRLWLQCNQSVQADKYNLYRRVKVEKLKFQSSSLSESKKPVKSLSSAKTGTSNLHNRTGFVWFFFFFFWSKIFDDRKRVRYFDLV